MAIEFMCRKVSHDPAHIDHYWENLLLGLIGETIERYSKDLEALVFVQYAALKNPRLGGAQNHRAFVE